MVFNETVQSDWGIIILFDHSLGVYIEHNLVKLSMLGADGPPL